MMQDEANRRWTSTSLRVGRGRSPSPGVRTRPHQQQPPFPMGPPRNRSRSTSRNAATHRDPSGGYLSLGGYKFSLWGSKPGHRVRPSPTQVSTNISDDKKTQKEEIGNALRHRRGPPQMIQWSTVLEGLEGAPEKTPMLGPISSRAVMAHPPDVGRGIHRSRPGSPLRPDFLNSLWGDPPEKGPPMIMDSQSQDGPMLDHQYAENFQRVRRSLELAVSELQSKENEIGMLRSQVEELRFLLAARGAPQVPSSFPLSSDLFPNTVRDSYNTLIHMAHTDLQGVMAEQQRREKLHKT